MKATQDMLTRALVRTFYRHYAGLFFFLFILFFGIVAPSQQLSYHYRLIMGMLETKAFLALVMLFWVGCAFVCIHWVRSRLKNPAYVYLFVLPGSIGKEALLRMLIRVQIFLYLPVWIYAVAVAGVAVCKGMIFTAVVVVLDMCMVCLACSRLYRSWILDGGVSSPIRP